MPDDTPENIDLRFLAEQQSRILGELAERREQTKLIPQIVLSVSELQIALAATRADVGVVKETVEDISERLQTVEGRLNTIDSRLHRKAHRACEGMSLLKARYSVEIETAISKAKDSLDRETVEAANGAEAYAYPHDRGIIWGVNAAGTGENILRGVRRPDGVDEAVS
jgi:hypothetical protein